MRLRLLRRSVALTVLVLLAQPTASRSSKNGELHTEFGEIRLQNLAIGKTYSVSRIAAAPLVIRNTGDGTLFVRVDVMIPLRHELRTGVLPLPDRRWVQLEQRQFALPKHTTVRTDVRVTLPYDPDLAGKTFQVDLCSYTVKEATRRAVGQRHHLLFTVEMDYRDDTEATFSLRGRTASSAAAP